MSYSMRMMDMPVGRLRLVAEGARADRGSAGGRTMIRAGCGSGPLVEDEDHPILIEAERQLDAHFAGAPAKASPCHSTSTAQSSR